jgi:hypothetical protein
MATFSRWGGLLASFALVLCWVPGTGAAEAAKAVPQVYFIAGAGAPVDVTLDGEPVATLQPKEIHGPVDVPSGSGDHAVEFEAEDWSVGATVRLGSPSQDVVVHRPADATGDPVVTVFRNDVSPVAADRARLTVAHTAVVPPADVRVAGKVLFANIANGEFVTQEVPADTYSVDIVPTGGSTPVFGPLDLPVTAGALNRVFAIGQPQNGSMDAIVQVLPLRTTDVNPPADVPGGEAGLVAPPGTEPGAGVGGTAYAVLLGLGLACIAGAALTVRRVRVTRHDRSPHARR